MNDQNISTVLKNDGLLVAYMDMPGRSMNVFSIDMMDSLESLIIHVEENNAVKAVVITSKKSTFLVGADLSMIKMFTERACTDTHEQLVELCGRLGRIFRRLEKSTKPYVAALNGMALGGGLELSMACHARVASARKDVMLGLPEIKLGLLPGAGGTQRLPKLVGTKLGLKMLLIGEPLYSVHAEQYGLVDEVVNDENLLDAACKKASLMSEPCPPWDQDNAVFDSGDLAFGQAGSHSRIAKQLNISETNVIDNYPAYQAIMSCVTEGWDKAMDDALANEMDIFVKLIQDPVAGNMVRSLFLNRQLSLKPRAKSLDHKSTQVAVLGDSNSDIAERLLNGRADVISQDELSDDAIALIMNGETDSSAINVAWLTTRTGSLGEADLGVWLSPNTEHGCAIEIVKRSESVDIDAGLVLAKWFRATAVLITTASSSYLAELTTVNNATELMDCSDQERYLSQSLIAAKAWLDGKIANIEIADSAAVVAGLSPAFTGGPFSYITQQGIEKLQGEAKQASHYELEHFNWPDDFDRLYQIIS